MQNVKDKIKNLETKDSSLIPHPYKVADPS